MASADSNVKTTVDGNKLTIEVDLSKDFGDSKSGKTTVIASTLGNVDIEGHDGVKMGLNIYKSKKKK